MSVSIIGCGWLGQALATALLKENTQVFASFQSLETRDKLNQLNIVAIPLSLPLNDINITLETKVLFEQPTIVIAIPPQFKRGKKDYLEKIQQLVTLAELHGAKKLILLNSTSIYQGLSGDVYEGTSLSENDDKVTMLLSAEQLIKGFSKKTCILRLAGLLGPTRHPSRFLTAKRVYSDGNSWVNLVHQVDVVNIIKKMITYENVDEQHSVYNVVSNTRCNRKQFYQTAAQVKGLPLPEFTNDHCKESGKKVNGNKLREVLNYQYRHDNLLDWLKS